MGFIVPVKVEQLNDNIFSAVQQIVLKNMVIHDDEATRHEQPETDNVFSEGQWS